MKKDRARIDEKMRGQNQKKTGLVSMEKKTGLVSMKQKDTTRIDEKRQSSYRWKKRQDL